MQKSQIFLRRLGIPAVGGLVYIANMLSTFISKPPPLPTVRPTPTTVAPKPASPFDGPFDGNVQGGRLLRKVTPVYPAIMREKHWRPQLITIEAIVDEEGNVENARILGGHPLCNDAALQAVRQWKYSPTTLNGTPVKVIQRIALHCGEPPALNR